MSVGGYPLNLKNRLLKSRNDFDKLLSRQDIIARAKEWKKHPFFIKEAGTKSIKVTSLTRMFQEQFEEGESLRGTFICEGHEWRVLYYNTKYSEKCGIQNEIYVEIITEDAIMHRINMDCYEKIANWLFRYWNPGGVYAIEGWLLERS